MIERDKVPANTQVLTPADFSHTQSSNILDSLAKDLAGASLSDQSGNAFQRNLDYRGFTASPVPGTPQGLAVYQNGVRINESFGDVVNWDFIPEMAINRASLVPNNPRAQPFPTPPPEVSGTEIKFTVPVRYGIR